MAQDITQNLILRTTLQDGISKAVRQAASSSDSASARIDRNTKKNIAGFTKLTMAVRGFRNTLATIKAAIPGLAALTALVGGGMGFLAAARAASEFSSAMSEVSTLVDTSVVDMQKLRDGVLEVSNTFGETPTTVGKGLYQVISSGAVAAADSIALLMKAQELAVAGVASTTQAVDVLTTALNAYGLGVGEATRVSDVLFETVKQGKTTIPELAQNIGKAIPLAATLGVTLEELGAATAAMTKGGIATDMAITSLRGTMAAFLSPTTEAVALFKKYNIDVSKSAFETKGLVGILGDLEKKLGRSPELIAAIIPNIRALTGVLALTGKQANEFRRILAELENSAGATGEALAKQMADPAYRAQINIRNLKNAFIEMGEATINSFNEMIERAGGIKVVAEDLRAVGKAIGAVFGVVAMGIGDLLGNVNRVVEAMGGAEAFGDTVAKMITALGTVILSVSALVTDTLFTLAITISDLERKFFTMGGVIDDTDFRGFAASSEEARKKAVSLGEELSSLKGQLQQVERFGARPVKSTVSIYGVEFESSDFVETQEEQITRIRKEIAALESDIASLDRVAAQGIGGDNDTWFKRSIERSADVKASIEDVGKSFSDLQTAIGKKGLVGMFKAEAEIEWGDPKFKWPTIDPPPFVGPLMPEDSAFDTLTPEAFEYAKQLGEITLALEGNKQAILDYEIAGLRAAAVEATTNADMLSALNLQIDRIKELKQTRVDAARVKDNAEFAVAWNQIILDGVEAYGKRTEAHKKFAAAWDKTFFEQIDAYVELEKRSIQATNSAMQTINQLGAANAHTFEGRLHYERLLLEAERDRQLEQARGAKNFVELSRLINEGYDKQLEGLRPENLTGFTGMIRGAKLAMEDFVVYVKDDAAFAFDAMNDSMRSFSQGFGRAFVEFASGASSASAAFTAFAQNFIAQIAAMFAARAVAQMVGFFINAFSTGADTGADTGTTTGGDLDLPARAMGGYAGGSINDLQAYAKGGIVRGGLDSLRSYASSERPEPFARGGVVRGGLDSLRSYSAAEGPERFAKGGVVRGGLEGMDEVPHLARFAKGGVVRGGLEGMDEVPHLARFAKGGVVRGGLEGMDDVPHLARFAKGGVVRGGLLDMPIHAYAGGGPIVRKPHVALVGEGQYNEAIVPLPDGRSIPVDMRNSEGSSRGNTTEITVSPSINFSVQSLDPRGTVEVLLDPKVQKSLRAAIADSLVSGSDAAFSNAVKGA